MTSTMGAVAAGAALVALVACLAGPFLLTAVRRMRRQGIAFMAIAFGFLVFAASKSSTTVIKASPVTGASSVSVTTNGASGAVAVNPSDSVYYTVTTGALVSITWTADSGYQFPGKQPSFPTNVTASAKGDATNEVTLAASDLPLKYLDSISIDQDSALTLVAGTSTNLTLTLSPADAAVSSTNWTSSAEGVATVANGKVSAVAAGSATITAKVTDKLGNEKTAACAVTVEAAPIPLVTVTVAEVTGVESFKVYTNGVDAAHEVSSPYTVYSNDMVTVFYTAKSGYVFANGTTEYTADAVKADKTTTALTLADGQKPHLENVVATVGDKDFATLADAITNEATVAGSTVVLVKDNYTLAEALTIAQDITLDLGGNTMTSKVTVTTSANVVFTNGTIVTDGTLDNILSISSGKATIANDAIFKQGVSANKNEFIILNGGALDVYGTVDAAAKTGGDPNYRCCYAIVSKAAGTIVNCYEGCSIAASANAFKLNNENSASTLNVYGGTFTSAGNAYCPIKVNKTGNASTLNIVGGTFNSGFDKDCGGILCVVDLDTFMNGFEKWTDACKAKFSTADNISSESGVIPDVQPLSYFCADGYGPVLGSDGYYMVKKIVAKIGDVNYETLADAIAAAGNNATIKLMNNVTVDVDLTFSKSATIDLNGKKFTLPSGKKITVKKGVTLAFTNSAKSGSGVAPKGSLLDVDLGGLDLFGKIVVESDEGEGGVLDLSALGTDNGGLIVEAGGALDVSENGEVKLPSTLSSKTPNEINADYPGLLDAEEGAKVTTGSTTYEASSTGVFEVKDGANKTVADAEILYGSGASQTTITNAYTSLAEALGVVKDGGTVWLRADRDEADVTVKANTTLDLGSYTNTTVGLVNKGTIKVYQAHQNATVGDKSYLELLANVPGTLLAGEVIKKQAYNEYINYFKFPADTTINLATNWIGGNIRPTITVNVPNADMFYCLDVGSYKKMVVNGKLYFGAIYGDWTAKLADGLSESLKTELIVTGTLGITTSIEVGDWAEVSVVGTVSINTGKKVTLKGLHSKFTHKGNTLVANDNIVSGVAGYMVVKSADGEYTLAKAQVKAQAVDNATAVGVLTNVSETATTGWIDVGAPPQPVDAGSWVVVRYKAADGYVFGDCAAYSNSAPVQANAAEVTPATGLPVALPVVCQVVSKDGTTTNNCSSLAAAVEAASVNATITLLKDVTTEGISSIEKKLTLDLNGCTLSNATALAVTSSVLVKNGKNTSGGLVIDGAISVSGELMLNELGWGVGGIAVNRSGSLDITAANAGVAFPAGATPNWMKANNANFFGASTVAGAIVVVGETTYTYSGSTFTTADDVATAEIAGTGSQGQDLSYVESYTSLEAALAAVKVGGTVTLLKEITLTKTLTLDKAITLDLGDNTIGLPDANYSTGFVVDADAVISNGLFQSQLEENKVDSYAVYVNPGKSPTFKDLLIDAKYYEYGLICDSAHTGANLAEAYQLAPTSTVTCANVEVTGNGALIYAQWVNLTLDENCAAAHIVGDLFDNEAHRAAIYSCLNARVTIAGGGYSHEMALLSGNLGGKIVVDGGTFNGSVYSWMESGAHTDLEQYADYKASFQLNAGTFSGATIAFKEDSDAARKLDSFVKAEDVTVTAPDNFFWKGGTTLAKVVAMIGLTKYASLNDAIEAAKSDEQITVFAPATIETNTTLAAGIEMDTSGASLTIPEDVTLTLNGSLTTIENGANFTNNGAMVISKSATVRMGGDAIFDSDSGKFAILSGVVTQTMNTAGVPADGMKYELSPNCTVNMTVGNFPNDTDKFYLPLYSGDAPKFSASGVDESKVRAHLVPVAPANFIEYANGVYSAQIAVCQVVNSDNVTNFYATLEKAVAALKDSEKKLFTITLFKDGLTTDGLALDRGGIKVTIDLNGCVLTNGTCTIGPDNGGATATSVVIKNSVAGQGGLVNNGTVTVRQTSWLDLTALSWTEYGKGGLIPGSTGALNLANGGRVEFNADNQSPNWMAANYPDFLSQCVNGAVIKIGNDRYTKGANGWSIGGAVATAEVAGTGSFGQSLGYVESYTTVAAALAAVTNNGTVTLLQSVTAEQEKDLEIPETVTLDLTTSGYLIATNGLVNKGVIKVYQQHLNTGTLEAYANVEGTLLAGEQIKDVSTMKYPVGTTINLTEETLASGNIVPTVTVNVPDGQSLTWRNGVGPYKQMFVTGGTMVLFGGDIAYGLSADHKTLLSVTGSVGLASNVTITNNAAMEVVGTVVPNGQTIILSATDATFTNEGCTLEPNAQVVSGVDGYLVVKSAEGVYSLVQPTVTYSWQPTEGGKVVASNSVDSGTTWSPIASGTAVPYGSKIGFWAKPVSNNVERYEYAGMTVCTNGVVYQTFPRSTSYARFANCANVTNYDAAASFRLKTDYTGMLEVKGEDGVWHTREGEQYTNDVTLAEGAVFSITGNVTVSELTVSEGATNLWDFTGRAQPCLTLGAGDLSSVDGTLMIKVDSNPENGITNGVYTFVLPMLGDSLLSAPKKLLNAVGATFLIVDVDSEKAESCEAGGESVIIGAHRYTITEDTGVYTLSVESGYGNVKFAATPNGATITIGKAVKNGQAIVGETVTARAPFTDAKGYQFTKWESSIPVENLAWTTNEYVFGTSTSKYVTVSFTMPVDPVTVTAVYKVSGVYKTAAWQGLQDAYKAATNDVGLLDISVVKKNEYLTALKAAQNTYGTTIYYAEDASTIDTAFAAGTAAFAAVVDNAKLYAAAEGTAATNKVGRLLSPLCSADYAAWCATNKFDAAATLAKDGALFSAAFGQTNLVENADFTITSLAMVAGSEGTQWRVAIKVNTETLPYTLAGRPTSPALQFVAFGVEGTTNDVAQAEYKPLDATTERVESTAEATTVLMLVTPPTDAQGKAPSTYTFRAVAY